MYTMRILAKLAFLFTQMYFFITPLLVQSRGRSRTERSIYNDFEDYRSAFSRIVTVDEIRRVNALNGRFHCFLQGGLKMTGEFHVRNGEEQRHQTSHFTERESWF